MPKDDKELPVALWKPVDGGRGLELVGFIPPPTPVDHKA
jgi:hypothetical protein